MRKILFCLFCGLLIPFFSSAIVLFNVVMSAASCPNAHDGTIIITPLNSGSYLYSISGGVYSISPTFTGLVPGQYDVEVIDNETGDSGTMHVSIPVIGHITNSFVNASVCSNNLPYVFNGTNIYDSGTYTYTLTNSTGCDSVITLNLTISPAANSTTYISVCPSQLPYTWNGQQYTHDGVYTQTFPVGSDCDSTAILILNSTTDTWLGTINSSWEEPQNWSCGVPGSASNVVIDFGTVVIHASTTINTLTVSSSANLTVNSGVNLVILH